MVEADLPPLLFDPDTDPLFFTHHPNWSLPALQIVPVGVLFRAWRSGDPPPPLTLEPLGPLRLDGEDDPRVPKDYLTQNLIGHFHYMLGSTFEERDWRRARAEYAAAATASPDNDVLFYNLGLSYSRNGLLDDAVNAFERSHAINPRYLANVAGHPCQRPNRPNTASSFRVGAELPWDAMKSAVGEPKVRRTDEPASRSIDTDGVRLAWGNPASWKARWRDESLRRHLNRPLGERLRSALSLVLRRSDGERRST